MENILAAFYSGLKKLVDALACGLKAALNIRKLKFAFLAGFVPSQPALNLAFMSRTKRGFWGQKIPYSVYLIEACMAPFLVYKFKWYLFCQPKYICKTRKHIGNPI